MPWLEAAANTVVQIWRPVDEDAGGDPIFELKVRDLSGFISAVSELRRTGTTAGTASRDRVVVAKCMLPPTDSEGIIVDVQSGDELRYEDYRGVEQRREIVEVNPVHLLGELDHIIVEID